MKAARRCIAVLALLVSSVAARPSAHAEELEKAALASEDAFRNAFAVPPQVLVVRGRGRYDPWDRRGGFGGGFSGGAYDASGYVSCSAMDGGWEEHFMGHNASGYGLDAQRASACGQCRRSHGGCSYRCTAQDRVCLRGGPGGRECRAFERSFSGGC